MQKSYLIGIDIGTQGTKASLYDNDLQELATKYIPLNLLKDNEGHIIQDPEEIFQSVIDSITDLVRLAEVSNIKAIGIDGQMSGIFAIDENWNAVYPYDSWLDNECKPFTDEMQEKAEEKIILSTGGQVTCGHGPKILWMKHIKPDIYKQTFKFVTLVTYVVGRLCNLKAQDAYIDDTHLHFSGFANNIDRTWNLELLSMFDVPVEKMPKIVSSDTIIGEVELGIAQKCGLNSDVKVIAGMGDTIASSLGAGITQKEMVFDVAGTASVFSLSMDKFVADTRHKTIMCARTPIKDLWAGYAYISGGGLCLKWIKDIVKGNYTGLDENAKGIPVGSNNLIFIPHFAGRTCPNEPSIKGTFLGLSWNHEGEHMYRAVMESIAYEYSLYKDILNEYGLRASIIYGTGGGSSSAIFNQIKADVLNLPYVANLALNTATKASAAFAGYSVGIIDDIANAIQKNSISTNTIYPDKNNHMQYKEHASTYKTYLSKLHEIYNEV